MRRAIMARSFIVSRSVLQIIALHALLALCPEAAAAATRWAQSSNAVSTRSEAYGALAERRSVLLGEREEASSRESNQNR